MGWLGGLWGWHGIMGCVYEKENGGRRFWHEGDPRGEGGRVDIGGANDERAEVGRGQKVL